MEIIEAIEKLKESHALVCLENRALIKMEKDKVYIWHSQWHSKLSTLFCTSSYSASISNPT